MTTPTLTPTTVTIELDAKQAATFLRILECAAAWHAEWNTYVRDNGDRTEEEAQAADVLHDAEDSLAHVLRAVVTHTFPETVALPTGTPRSVAVPVL